MLPHVWITSGIGSRTYRKPHVVGLGTKDAEGLQMFRVGWADTDTAQKRFSGPTTAQTVLPVEAA